MLATFLERTNHACDDAPTREWNPTPPRSSLIFSAGNSLDDSAPTIANGPKITIDPHLFATLHSDPLLHGLAGFNGSNSWVVSPKRSKSGQAILANDPHITFSKPAVWYEAHIASPTLDLPRGWEI